MKPLIALFALAASLQAVTLPIEVDPATPLTGTYAVEWNTDGEFENWTTSQVTGASVESGGISGTASGSTPRIILSNFSGPDLDLGFNDYLELRIQVPATHTGDIKISYGTTAKTGFSAARVLVIPDAQIPTDGDFHTYRIDVGPEPWWRATLRDLRIEPSTTSGQSFVIDYLRVGDRPGDVYLPNYGWNSDNEMVSKHFRFLWDANRASQGVNATTARGALRNAEEAWQVYVKIMGYREPAESTTSPNGNKYKVNFLCIYNGFYMNSTWDGFAYLNIDPSGLQVDPPTWIIPHELMHVFQHHNNNGHYSGQWETHANYGRERWLQHYQVFYPNRSNIEALGVRDGHFMISSGRNYYLTWPFLYYVDDNPDNLSDLSDGMIKRLWQESQPGEFWPATLDRLTPTTSLKDISGYFARRCATWDFSNQAAMTAELNNQDPAHTARHHFTDLIQRPDAPSWWRVPANKAPAQGAYALHELLPTSSGAGRVVTVNFEGLTDSARGADWRASFIAINDSGSERYTPLWSTGSSAITLAANENKLYLAVAGTPDWYANGGFNEATEPFRSHPSRTRFHYQIQVTGATPRERNNGSSAGLVQHSNGGGWKSVIVPASVFIGPNARVTGGSVSGNARIEDYAVVSGGTVNSSAIVSGHAWVRGGTVTGYARVRDWATIDNGTISGNARVLEHATVEGNMQDTAVAKGSAWHQFGGTLSGNAIVDGDYMGNKTLSGGITFGHMPFVGIPDNFTTATPVGHYASYDFKTAHDSRALDRYGITDAFAIGAPAWTSTDWKRSGFLSFDGSSQYLVLDRSVADMRAFTFAAWVKPNGGPANQALLWLGSSPTRRLYLTPNDGSGNVRFSIVNGGLEQTLLTSALPNGVWSHIAVTLDGSSGSLFVNGSAVATGAITIAPEQILAPNTSTSPQHYYLARSQGTESTMFQGALDDAQFFSSALNAAQLAAVTVPLAGDVLLSDNFNSASNGASVFNSTLPSDQQGLLAPLSYSIAGYNADFKLQHGNGGQMLMAGWFGGENLDLYASLNHNFAIETNSLNKPLKVQFDLKITDASNINNWATIAIGSAQNVFVNNGANIFSSLFRQNGHTQQFSSGADISNGATWSAASSTIAVIFSDATGTASPFNNTGSLAKMYINGTLAGIYPLAPMTANDGYLSFEGNGVFANYDNLSISIVSNPGYAVTYNGNSNTSGVAPNDTNSPYAANATVTVLGNTGELQRTGYVFTHWNTAANGSGTTYLPGATFNIASSVTLHAQWSPETDFVWNNGAGTGLWNNTDANWSGSLWVNAITSHPVFNNSNGTITMAQNSTGGNLSASFGGRESGTHEVLIAGNHALSLKSIRVNGCGLGGNCDSISEAANQRLSLSNSSATITGDVYVRRGSLLVKGDTIATITGTLLCQEFWGLFTIQDQASLTASGGINFSPIANALHLNGGTLNTPFIHVGNATWDSTTGVHLNGTTIMATQDNPDFLQVFTNGNPVDRTSAMIAEGGLVFHTSGHSVAIATSLTGSGAMSKIGAGTLTLTAPNSYTGGTIVNDGKLVLDTGTAAGTGRIRGALVINPGGTVETAGDGTGLGWINQISSVTINGGLLTSAANNHIWNIPGGIIMTGGTLQSNGGVHTSNGPQLEWNKTDVTTQPSAETATIAGRIRMRSDGGFSGIMFTVADGVAATDLLVQASITEAAGGMGISKFGSGTLALPSPNYYTGTTTVHGGTLRLGNGTSNTNLADSADVILAAGAALHLDYAGTDSIDELTVAGVAKPPGVYSSSNSLFITGSGTLTVLTGPPADYDLWKATNSVNGGPNDDDDNDGSSNLWEYAFGLDPKSSRSHSPYLAFTPLNSGVFTYNRRRSGLSGLVYTVWTSTDLRTWTKDANASQTATTIPSTDNESVHVTISPSRLLSDRLFVRIQAD